MASKKPRSSTSSPPSYVHIRLDGVTFHLNKECMISRSAKLTALLGSKKYIDLTSGSCGIPIDAKTFELVAKFCYAEDPSLAPETAIPLACAASYLEIGSLCQQSISFLITRVLPYWNETVRALVSAAPIIPYAHHLGLIDACLRSIIDKAIADPSLLGDPIDEYSTSTEDAAIAARTGVKRRLFTVERLVEDLSSLPLALYSVAVSVMTSSGIPAEQLAVSLYRYTKRWVGDSIMVSCAADGGELGSVEEMSNRREVIETVEKLMPNEKGVLHVGCLFDMLRAAIIFQASSKCRDGIETRIGKQLHEASINDLFIPCYGYTKETRVDVKCVKRMVDHWASRNSWNQSEIEAVSGLLEVFLAEVARDENLSKDVFVGFLEILAAMGDRIQLCHDGLYCAIDMYLASHRHLTEGEREEVCRVLDCNRMSGRACEHAAQNEQMPLRVVAQVLFVGQRRIREAIIAATSTSTVSSNGRLSEENQPEQEKRMVVGGSRGDDDDEEEEEMREDMMTMDNRVMELERECGKMRTDIGIGSELEGGRKEGRGLWMGMKDLFGCKGRPREYNCPGVKRKNKKQKIHPRIGGA